MRVVPIILAAVCALSVVGLTGPAKAQWNSYEGGDTWRRQQLRERQWQQQPWHERDWRGQEQRERRPRFYAPPPQFFSQPPNYYGRPPSTFFPRH